MRNVLVLANETLGGTPLLAAVSKEHAQGDTHFIVCVPKNRPRHGNVIYDAAVEDAARLRIDLALAFMREQGIDGEGEIGDADPFNAAMDVIGSRQIDALIVSTLPVTASGWLKRDLVERLRQETGLPVEHVVFDVDTETFPFETTLVIANQTVAGQGLVEALKAKEAAGPHRFIVVVPQDSGDGRAAEQARARLTSLLDSLTTAGLVGAGMIGDPDPFTAAMNTLQFFRIADIVVSTLPVSESKWLKQGLLKRLADSSGRTIDHVVSSPAKAGAA